MMLDDGNIMLDNLLMMSLVFFGGKNGKTYITGTIRNLWFLPTFYDVFLHIFSLKPIP